MHDACVYVACMTLYTCVCIMYSVCIKRCMYVGPMYVWAIGVRANIHVGGGGATEFCPNGFGGGGVVAEIFRDPYSVGGG